MLTIVNHFKYDSYVETIIIKNFSVQPWIWVLGLDLIFMITKLLFINNGYSLLFPLYINSYQSVCYSRNKKLEATFSPWQSII